MADKGDQIWAPYNYLAKIPGKGMRSIHIEAFNAVLEAPSETVSRVKEIVQQLHTTSLLLDDVEDRAVLRRGQPVAHNIFGTPRTINTASFVMLSALRMACKEFPESSDMLLEELLALHKGQGLDLYWRDTHTCPTEAEYEEMVICKTGGLYRLAVKLLQASSPYDYEMVPIADCLGLIYQIQDDLLNLQSDSYISNKGFAEDITEGKYSFPVIHCFRSSNSPESAELASILMQNTHEVELKNYALHILAESGSLNYTVDAIKRHYYRAKELIDQAQLPDPTPLMNLLDQLVRPTLGKMSLLKHSSS